MLQALISWSVRFIVKVSSSYALLRFPLGLRMKKKVHKTHYPALLKQLKILAQPESVVDPFRLEALEKATEWFQPYALVEVGLPQDITASYSVGKHS